MYFKKGISPVVAMALLLVVAVVAVTSFQTWFSSYSSELYNDAEVKSDTSVNTQIERVIDSTLYFRNGFDNISISNVTVEGIGCNVSNTYSKGVKQIYLTNNCTQNLSTTTPEIVVYTDKGIYSEKYFNKQTTTLSTQNQSEESGDEESGGSSLCNYPLDDDGTISGAFGYDLLNMLSATNYTQYSHTISAGSSPSHIGLHNNPFVNYSIPVDSGLYAFEVEITDLPDMSGVSDDDLELNIEALIFGSNGVDNLAGDSVSIAIEFYKNKVKLDYASFSNTYSGDITTDSLTPLQVGDRVGYYINTSSGDVGVIYKGIDLGYLGVDIKSANAGIATSTAVGYSHGLSISDSSSSPTSGDTVGAKIMYDDSNMNFDYYTGTQNICNASLSVAPTPSCSLSFGASKEEIDLQLNVNNDDLLDRLTLSNNNLTGTYTVQSGVPSGGVAHYMMPENWGSFLTGQKFDSTSGLKVFAVNIDSPTTINDNLTQSFLLRNINSSTLIAVQLKKNSSGYNVRELFTGTDIVTGLGSAPNQIAAYFNSSSGQYGISVDSLDYGVVSSYNTSQPLKPLLAVEESPGISGTRAGEQVQMTYVQSAAGITANVPTSSTDSCGVSI